LYENLKKMSNLFVNIKRETILFVLYSLFIISFPITFNLNSIVIITMCIFFFIDKKENIKNKINDALKNKIILAFFFYFIVQCLGLIYSKDITTGINVITRLISFVFLPTLITTEKLSVKKINTLLNIQKYWISLFVLCIVFTQVYVEGRLLRTVVHFAFESYGISQHYIGILIIITLMFVLHQMIEKVQVFLNTIVFILLFGFLLLLSSRTSLLMFIFLAVLFFLTNFKKIRTVVKISVLIIFLGISSSLYFNSSELKRKVNVLIKTTDFDIGIITTKNSITYTKNNFEHRILIWHCALNIIYNHPLIGIGTGDYRIGLNEEYEKINFLTAIDSNFDTHNQYLEDFLKAGVLGILSLLFLYGLIFKLSLKNKRFLFYCIFCIAFLSLFESYLERHHGTVFIAFFIPLFIKYETKLT